MSIARSTPAQNDRGPANTTDRGPARSAHTLSDGPIRRSTRSAFAPAPTVRNRPNGVYAVSTITRTTATGRSRVGSARTTAEDSMSTASAPVRANRSRSGPVTM